MYWNLEVETEEWYLRAERFAEEGEIVIVLHSITYVSHIWNFDYVYQ